MPPRASAEQSSSARLASKNSKLLHLGHSAFRPLDLPISQVGFWDEAEKAIDIFFTSNESGSTHLLYVVPLWIQHSTSGCAVGCKMPGGG